MAAAAATAGRAEEFHVRYYVGNKGRFGHEFLELEVSLPGKPGSPGRLRYANSPGAKRGPILRKEVLINPLVVKEIQKIVFESKILQCNDDKWPEPNELGKQEIEIVTPSDHVCFACAKVASLSHAQRCEDAAGMTCMYYLAQDLRRAVFSLVSLHFKVKPVP